MSRDPITIMVEAAAIERARILGVLEKLATRGDISMSAFDAVAHAILDDVTPPDEQISVLQALTAACALAIAWLPYSAVDARALCISAVNRANGGGR